MKTCPKCGTEANTKFCPDCGNPMSQDANGPIGSQDAPMFVPKEEPIHSNKEKIVYVEKEKHTGFWSVGRLVIGIISMVLFMFIIFQSCAVGFGNALEDNNASSGSSGLFTGIMFLIAGIVGLCTRNAKSKVGAIITAVVYFIGAILTIGTGDTYGDLPIWGILAAIFGIVYIICAIKTQKERVCRR